YQRPSSGTWWQPFSEDVTKLESTSDCRCHRLLKRHPPQIAILILGGCCFNFPSAPLFSARRERSKGGGKALSKDPSRPAQVQSQGHRKPSRVALLCWSPDCLSAVAQCGLL